MAEYDVTKNLADPIRAAKSQKQLVEIQGMELPYDVRVERGVGLLQFAIWIAAVAFVVTLVGVSKGEDSVGFFVFAALAWIVATVLSVRGVIEIVYGFIRYAKDT